MAFREYSRHDIGTVENGNSRVIKKGDKLGVLWRDIHAATSTLLASTPVEKDIIVDSISFFEVTDEMGFESGVGAIIGKKIETPAADIV